MNARWSGHAIVVDAPARERLHESGGVGRPRQDGGVLLSWVEALYLLDRADLTAVEGEGFSEVLADPPDPHALERWLVYRDLRERGYYVSVSYDPGDEPAPGDRTLEVHPRGAPPTTDEVAFHVAVVSETTVLSLADLDVVTLGISDDEGEITYLEVDSIEPTGETALGSWTPPAGVQSGHAVLVSDPPQAMVEEAFFGRPLSGLLLLNPLEARYLAENELLDIELSTSSEPAETRRYRVYAALRDRGCVPRSGFKFGADFRVYTRVADASDPGHSSYLVEVRDDDATATPRSLSRAVRLAGGVRKQHLLALVDGQDVQWVALERKRP